MSQPPQQPWNQPPPPSWGVQQPPQQWGAPLAPAGGGSTPLLVLGLAAAVLGLLGTVLPSVHYPDDAGYFGPLFQAFGGSTQFLASGLVPLAGTAVLVAGAVLQRRRPALGTGLLLVGAGVFVDAGLRQLLVSLQSVLDSGLTSTNAVGGILLILAGCTATATAVVGLVRLSRLR